MHVRNTLPFFTVTDMSQSEAKPASSLVRMERDAMMSEEPAANLERIEVGTSEILVLPPASRLLFNAHE